MTDGVSFSVVITSYNYKDFVIEAIESVLGQSRPASQVIVVDDGSTDGSAEILRQRYGTDPRVILIFGVNGGQLVAFKRAVAVATGMVVCFLDADDRWRSDYLAKISRVYDVKPDIDFIFTDVRFFGKQQGELHFADRDLDLGYTAIATYMTGFWYGAPTSALSLKISWARRVLNLPENLHETFRISADACIGFGASVLGARKYYLRTDGSMEYRIHGKNGWWTKRTPDADYYHELFRIRGLIEIYARSVGLNERCRYLAKREFRTKPDPSWEEASRYASIGRRGHLLRHKLRTWLLFRKRLRT